MRFDNICKMTVMCKNPCRGLLTTDRNLDGHYFVTHKTEILLSAHFIIDVHAIATCQPLNSLI